MSDALVIGLDIGTTGAKAVALTAGGVEVARARMDYPTRVPNPGWAEQDPDEVVQAALGVVRRCVEQLGTRRDDLVAISLSSVWHSLMVLQEESYGRHSCLTPLITWADLRATREARTLANAMDPAEVYRRTGCPVHPMYWPAKIKWCIQHAMVPGSNPSTRVPQRKGKTTRYLSIKEYFLYRLFRCFVVDRSVASGTGLLNIRSGEWDVHVLGELGIDRSALSEVVSATHILSGMDAGAAEAMGIPPSVPVVVGSGDGALSSLGVGGVGRGVFTIMVGGSGAIRTSSKEPLLDPKMRTYCYHMADGYYLTGGAINNGALALNWYVDGFMGQRLPGGLRDIDRVLEMIPSGSGGLVFLPFMAGERSPNWNPDMRGVIVGLDLSHTPYHLMRALAEGICFRLRSVFDALCEVAGKPVEVRVSSGLMSSPRFRQMMCDVLGVELSIPATEENSATGAALLGFVAMGMLPDVDSASQCVKIVERVAPSSEASLYEGLYQKYRKAYEAAAPLFAG